MEKLIGAFIFPEVWKSWTGEQAERFLDKLAAVGVNAIFTESDDYRNDLIDIGHRKGLKWIGGISCYSDHSHKNEIVKVRPELWPVGEDGELRPQMEWYLGVTPGFEDWDEECLVLAEKIVRSYDLDGFFLDFIRWPVHWELELRPGTRKPLQYSFDPHTLASFQIETGIELPAILDEAAKNARWIMTNHYHAWVDFKCRIITRFVERCMARLRAVRQGSLKLGLYSLPMPADDLQAVAGQRLSELAPLIDLIAPMTYHAILHYPIDWVSEVISETVRQAEGKALPVLQVDSAEGAESGADWGPPVPVKEWGALLEKVLPTVGISGIVAFTGTSLFRDGRGAILKKKLAKTIT